MQEIIRFICLGLVFGGALFLVRWVSLGSTEARVAILEADSIQSMRYSVTEDGKYLGTLTLRNSGTATAVIESVNPGCGCTGVTISTDRIPPGSDCQVTFHVDPKRAPPSVLRYSVSEGRILLSPSCRMHGVFQNQIDNSGNIMVVCAGEIPLPIRIADDDLFLRDVVIAGGPTERLIPFRTDAGVIKVSAKINGFPGDIPDDPAAARQARSTCGWPASARRGRRKDDVCPL